MSDVCALSSEMTKLIEQIAGSGGRQTISLSIEAAISQNSFILELWQTFMIAHTAIWAGLITFKHSMPKSYYFIFSIPYLFGLFINGNSLSDAYIGLEALYDDICFLITTQKIQSNIPNLYKKLFG
jgi:hypothetical protein